MTPAARARFRVLGPVAVEVDGRLWEVPGRQRQFLLAALLAHGDAGLGPEALAEVLAEVPVDGPSATAASTPRAAVSRLRKALGDQVPGVAVANRASRYVVERAGVALDSEDLEAHLAAAAEAGAQGDHERAAAEAGAALALWRGPAFGEAADLLILAPEVARLDELHGVAFERRAAALLALDRHVDAAAELVDAVARMPLREELRRLLLLALARADRQVEALAAYEDYRRLLAEHGMEPSTRLADLDRRIAVGDPSLRRPIAGAAVGRWPLPPEVTATSTLVGRAGELDRLDAALRTVAAGGHGLVVVSGEAGVGKSHLVAALASSAQEQGALVLAGACDDALRAPYGPVVRALRHVRDQGGTWAEESLAPWWPELARLLPETRAAADGGPAPGASPADPPTDPQTDLFRLLDAVAGWLGDLARTAPVVLVIEDLHWAPDPTLLALRRLAQPGGLDGLLVVATVREPEPDRPPLLDEVVAAARRSGSLLDEVALEGLGADEVAELVVTLRDDLEVDETFVGQVAEVTAGNPLFVTELVADLAAAELPQDRRALPSAGALVARRLRQIDRATAQVLTEAAVIGLDVALDLLVAASTAPPEVVLAALDAAIDAGLVQVVPDPRQRVRFTHAVVRDALVARSGRAERTEIHRRVAAALLALPPAARARHVEALARHVYEAAVVDGPSAPVEPLVDAGDAALAQRAYRHAADWYERALALADRPGASDQDRFALLAAMGDAQRRAGDDRFRRSILDAAELARSAGDGERLARAALVGSRGFYRQTALPDQEWIDLLREAVAVAGDALPAARALLLASLASELVWDDPDETRFALADEALALARAAGDPTVLGQVLVLRLTTIWTPETVTDCQEAATEALAATAAAADPALRCHALRFAAGAALEQGDRRRAEDLLAEAEAATDEVAQPDLQWHLTLARAAWALLAGDLEAATALAVRSLASGTAAGQPEALAFFGIIDIEVRRLRGDLAEVIDLMTDRAPTIDDPIFGVARYLAAAGRPDLARPGYEAAIADLDAIGRGLHTLAALGNLAALAAGFDDAATAAELHRRLAPHADHLPQGIVTLPVVHHHLGLLALTSGRHDLVPGHLSAAVAFSRSVEAPLHEAESHLVWARWHQSVDDPAAAEEHRAQARALAVPRGALGLLTAAGVDP